MRRRGHAELDTERFPFNVAFQRDELLRLPAVIRKVGLRKTAIYEKMRRAEFPKFVAIGRRARAWRASEIEKWIAERI